MKAKDKITKKWNQKKDNPKIITKNAELKILTKNIICQL